MSVKIRLSRVGTKKKPFYRIVVADSRSPRDGRCIEIIGTYNPLDEPIATRIDEEKAIHWLKNGAQLTNKVHGLFSKSGLLDKAVKSSAKN